MGEDGNKIKKRRDKNGIILKHFINFAQHQFF